MIIYAGGDLPGINYMIWFGFLVYAAVVGFGVVYLTYFFIRKRTKK